MQSHLPTLQMRKQSPREVIQLAQVSQCQTLECNLHNSNTRSNFTHCHPLPFGSLSVSEHW